MTNSFTYTHEKFADCLCEKDVCLLYAEIRLEADRQMEYMLEALKERDNGN